MDQVSGSGMRSVVGVGVGDVDGDVGVSGEVDSIERDHQSDVGRSSQADFLERNSAMDDSIGGS